MDLRQVEYVVAIVDHGGFTRAAAALYVAQPSLSQAVRRLEHDLGAPLFVRRGRGVSLSPAGEAFLGPARRMLRAAAQAAGEVALHAEASAGRLDLVSLPTLVADPLAELIGRYRLAFPDVVIRLAEPANAAGVLQSVRDGRSEIGLTELGPVGDGVRSVPLGEQSLVVVLPASGIDPPVPIRGTRVAVAELARVPMVLGPRGTSIRELVETAFAAAGVAPWVVVETAQREAIVPLVLAGAGASVLPESLAGDAVRRGATMLRAEPPITRSLALVHPTDDLSPAADRFLQMVAIASG